MIDLSHLVRLNIFKKFKITFLLLTLAQAPKIEIFEYNFLLKDKPLDQFHFPTQIHLIKPKNAMN